MPSSPVSAAALDRPSLDLLPALLASLQDGLAVADADGRLVEVNDRLCAMTGFAREDLVGRCPPHPHWPGEQHAALAALAARVASGHDVHGEVLLGHRGGARFPAALTASPLRDPAGRVVGQLVVVRHLEASRRLTAELSALREVALEVARDAPPERIFGLVAREAAGLLAVESAIVARFDPGGATVVGSHGTHSRVDEILPVAGVGVLARIARTGRPARVSDYLALPASSAIRAHALEHGYRASVGAPVEVSGRVWGAVLATTKAESGLPEDAGERLARYAELVGLGVASAAAREELRRLATTDALTRVANRRAFDERLAQEIERARRHGRALSLVLIDLDHFKRVNDEHGHPTGDRVLAEFAERLRRRSRAEDTVARLGGEEFGWLMPEVEALHALRAAERLRVDTATGPFAGGLRVTISAGICDLRDARGASELYRLADEALYRAKAHGRDQVWRWSPTLGEPIALGATAAADRHQAERGVRALARAVDAKDPATRLHSERVADLAMRLATALGWPPERVSRLGEAALVHDVGKIAVPDGILLKPGPLDSVEYELVKAHAALSTVIAGDLLDAEAAGWVGHHHERWDGGGYPSGRAGADIPEGARILAVADAFDVMRVGPVYAPARSLAETLAECRREAGRQFCPATVAALLRLAADGGLPAPPPTVRARGRFRAPAG